MVRDRHVAGRAIGSTIAIVNYEKFNPEKGKTGKDAAIPEVRHLAGVILDESSRLAMGGGKQKWVIIQSTKGIPYKLSCTATPAPNDTMEFASQASFLERMRRGRDHLDLLHPQPQDAPLDRQEARPQGVLRVHVELVDLRPRSAAVRLAEGHEGPAAAADPHQHELNRRQSSC
jgi:hypothetical protein